MLINVNDSYIYCQSYSLCIKDYVDYIIDLLKSILNLIFQKYKVNFNIIIGHEKYNFNNNNTTLILNINFEHTLVKKGGRSIPDNCSKGKILTDEGELYLVRIYMYEKLTYSNIIIDYSIPNIRNISTSNNYNSFSEKLLYIAPVIYNYELTNFMNKRDLDVLTTFINTEEPRRHKLLNNIRDNNINHKNVNNCYEKTSLKELYLNTKIIINIHQTEHHHTFEELRCLPALLNGVIVISENSPLNELVPYNEFIIWTSYYKIIDTLKDVINNYEFYYNKIFNNTTSLENMHQLNIEELTNKLTERLHL